MYPHCFMKSTMQFRGQQVRPFRPRVYAALSCLGICLGSTVCLAQGTMTITFTGPPPGQHTQSGANPYNDPSGMQFGSLTPQSLYLNGGGIPGYPNNGTTYLEIPAGSMRFGFNVFPPTQSYPFNLVSFDAAEYASFGPQTLEVVGYQIPQVMGPLITVTNYFTVSSQIFQTFYLDSSFQNVFRVDVLNASWSLDNVVISGVPEPSTGSLALVGAVGAVAWSRFRRTRRNRQTNA